MEKVKFTKTVFFAYPPVLTTCDGKKLYKICRPHKCEQKSPTFILINHQKREETLTSALNKQAYDFSREIYVFQSSVSAWEG